MVDREVTGGQMAQRRTELGVADASSMSLRRTNHACTAAASSGPS